MIAKELEKELEAMNHDVEQLEIMMDEALKSKDSSRILTGQGMRLMVTLMIDMQRTINEMHNYTPVQHFRSDTRIAYESCKTTRQTRPAQEKSNDL